MAKDKKHFDCKTCNEKINYLGVEVCTLRIKNLDEYKLPNESSLCEKVLECEFYRLDTKSNIKEK